MSFEMRPGGVAGARVIVLTAPTAGRLFERGSLSPAFSWLVTEGLVLFSDGRDHNEGARESLNLIDRYTAGMILVTTVSVDQLRRERIASSRARTGRSRRWREIMSV
jgi:hypothetical protein